MESKNLEEFFKIEIIASIIENKILYINDKYYSINNYYSDLCNFCSFITGEEVNFSDIYRFAPTIKKIIIEQYPDMAIPYDYNDDFEILSETKMKRIINRYKIIYGSYIMIKSLKKEMVKSLKIQDK